jgi:hypothetical protein
MKTPILLAFSAFALSACAGLTGPSADEIARLPVVRYGQTAPADGNFVLLYPAGANLPVNTKVVGSLFEKTDEATLNVRVKRDIYIYRNQVSLDGKTWSIGHDKVGGQIHFALPGDKEGKRDGKSPGELTAEFNLK